MSEDGKKEEYDLIGLNIGGMRFAMRKEVAFALFEAMQGSEVYRIETWYKNGDYSNRKQRAYTPDFDEHLTLTALNPVIFHSMLISQKEYEEYEGYERAKKNA